MLVELEQSCDLSVPKTLSKTAYSKEQRKIKHKEVRRAKKRNNEFLYKFDNSTGEYYFEDGFRKVYPYHFTFTTFVKQRWLGKRLIDLLSEEFHANSVKSFMDSVSTGAIRINGNIVNPDYELCEGDKLTNYVHRHELPVLDVEIPVVYEDDKVLVINKPASIPCHACGRYNYNSISHILARERGSNSYLRSVHRLDRMTSGVLIFGKDYDTAVKLSHEILARNVTKTYVSRVVGKFPNDGEIVCKESIGPLSSKMGINWVRCTDEEGAKPAETVFKLLKVINDKHFGVSSIVQCNPKTGRTHQIRVHLQYLGFPIVNDPIYNDICVWGVNNGSHGDFGGQGREDLIHALEMAHPRDNYDLILPNKKARKSCVESGVTSFKNTFVNEKFVKDDNCLECVQSTEREMCREDLILYLHALSYEGEGWKYEVPMPDWAQA